MPNTPDKVKYGLKNVHYAKASFDEDLNVTFDIPKRIPGAVSLTMDPEGTPETFWADNSAYYVFSNNTGYAGDLEIALVPVSFLTEILHEEEDEKGVMLENADVELEHFALLFEFDGDKNKFKHILYNCTSSRPSIQGSTTSGSKEPQTDTLRLIATPLANGLVKAKSGPNTDKTVYANWYKEVYLPQVIPDGEEVSM